MNDNKFKIMPVIPRCSQCGFLHPPLHEGDICPMTKEKTVGGDEIDFSDFLYNLRKFLTEKIKEKEIKDYKKMFSSLMIEIIKQIENFQE